MSGLEYIAELLARFRLLEPIYRVTKTPPSDERLQKDLDVKIQFEKTVTELYVKVLEYQIRMACHYARSRVQRYLRNVAMRDDWKSILASIKQYEQSSRY